MMYLLLSPHLNIDFCDLLPVFYLHVTFSSIAIPKLVFWGFFKMIFCASLTMVQGDCLSRSFEWDYKHPGPDVVRQAGHEIDRSSPARTPKRRIYANILELFPGNVYNSI